MSKVSKVVGDGESIRRSADTGFGLGQTDGRSNAVYLPLPAVIHLHS